MSRIVLLRCGHAYANNMNLSLMAGEAYVRDYYFYCRECLRYVEASEDQS